jgi:hypothetical protein
VNADDYLHEKLGADCMRKRGRLVEREYPHAFRAPYTNYSEEEIRGLGRKRIDREEAAEQESAEIKSIFAPEVSTQKDNEHHLRTTV